MNLINTGPLKELIHSVHQEIAKHKWIESEKAGRDIGFQQAVKEWLEFHFPQWVRQEKERTIEAALRAQER